MNSVENHMRDQLLGKVVRPVVVRTVSDHNGEPIGTCQARTKWSEPALDAEIRRAGSSGRGFGKTNHRSPPKSPYTFICGDVMETEALLRFQRQLDQ